MSGHSHWKTIKAKKGTEDARRSKLFSKYSRLISVAARGGSADPSENFKLRQAIDKAKEIDMPSNTIERAIKKGTGELEGIELQEITLEAYGPAKTAIVIEGITDNKNRTIAEVKKVLSKNGGKLAEPGSVKYLFNAKGILTMALDAQAERFKNKDELELAAIDAGAEDVQWNENLIDVYIDIDNLERTKQALEKNGVKIKSAVCGWQAKNEISVSGKEEDQTMRLFSALDDSDDVQEIYSNLNV